MTFQRRIVALVVLATGATVLARPKSPPDAIGILRDADAATKALRSITYHAEFYAEGKIADRIAPRQGEVTMRKKKRKPFDLQWGYQAPPTRVRGTVTRPNHAEPIRFDVGLFKREAFLLDHEARVCLRGTLPIARVPYSSARALIMREYAVPKPFSDEIGGKLARHEGVVEIGGVTCDVLFVIYKNDSESRWCFGQDDHLPRRVERISQGGKTVLTLTDLHIDPDIGDEVFRPACPEGYTERERVRIEPDPEALRELAGTYRIDEKSDRTVIVEGSRIFTRRTGNPKMELFPAGGDTFYYADLFVSLTFVRDENGKVSHQILDRLFGDREKAVRVGDGAPQADSPDK